MRIAMLLLLGSALLLGACHMRRKVDPEHDRAMVARPRGQSTDRAEPVTFASSVDHTCNDPAGTMGLVHRMRGSPIGPERVGRGRGRCAFRV